MEDLTAFARLITAVTPWLGDLVLVGGWAHRMPRFHPLSMQGRNSERPVPARGL